MVDVQLHNFMVGCVKRVARQSFFLEEAESKWSVFLVGASDQLVTNFDRARARATSTPHQTRPDLIFSSKPIQSQRLQTRSPTQIHAQSIHASPMFQKALGTV